MDSRWFPKSLFVILLLVISSAAVAAPIHQALVYVSATIPEYRACTVLAWNPLEVEVQANAPWVLVLTTDAEERVLQPPGHFAGVTRLLYWTDAVVTNVRLEAVTWHH